MTSEYSVNHRQQQHNLNEGTLLPTVSSHTHDTTYDRGHRRRSPPTTTHYTLNTRDQSPTMVSLSSQRPYGRPVIVEVKPNTSTSKNMPASPIISTSSVNGSPNRVRFASTPAQASRELHQHEAWSAWHWESHAVHCAECKNPIDLERRQGQLCDAGAAHAQDISYYIRYRDGDFYSTERDSTGQLVRVEIPPEYRQLRSLLRAQARGLRSRPVVNYDTTTTTISRRRQSTSPVRRNDYGTAIVTPSTTKSSSRPTASRRDSFHETSPRATTYDLFVDSDSERRYHRRSTAAPQPLRRTTTLPANVQIIDDYEAVRPRGITYYETAPSRPQYRTEIREPSSMAMAQAEAEARRKRKEKRASVWY